MKNVGVDFCIKPVRFDGVSNVVFEKLFKAFHKKLFTKHVVLRLRRFKASLNEYLFNSFDLRLSESVPGVTVCVVGLIDM